MGHIVGKSPSGILQSSGGSVSSQAETANVLNKNTGQMTQRAKKQFKKKGRQFRFNPDLPLVTSLLSGEAQSVSESARGEKLLLLLCLSSLFYHAEMQLQVTHL